jgi:hypothetical protein
MSTSPDWMSEIRWAAETALNSTLSGCQDRRRDGADDSMSNPSIFPSGD